MHLNSFVTHRYPMNSHYLFKRGKTLWWQHRILFAEMTIWFKPPHRKSEVTAKPRIQGRRGPFTLIYSGPPLVLILQLTQTRAGQDPTSIQLAQSNRGPRPEPAVETAEAESEMTECHKRQLENDEADWHCVSKPLCWYFILRKIKGECNFHIMKL